MKKAIWTICLLMVFLSSIMAFNGICKPVYAAADTQSVSVNTLASAAKVVIRQRAGVPIESDNLTIALLGTPAEVIVPAGNLNLSVSLPYDIRYNAPTTALVTIGVDGKVAAVATLKFDVKLYQQVVVAAQPIVKGEVLNEGNLRYQRMDVGRLGSGYYTDFAEVSGFFSRRMINPGTPLTKFLIEKPVLVKRNSAVRIVARGGGIEVTAFGQAMQDGYQGQIIRVQNINSRKQISAKVIDAGTVEVMTFKP